MRRSPVDHARATRGRIALIFPALLLSGLILSCPRGVEAQTWNGSVSDLWSNASNWMPNTVPNSTSASATVTNVTNNPVLIDIAPTIANLTVGASNSVSLNNGESLEIAGGTGAGSLAIAGTLTLGSTGFDTDLILGGTSGSTITLSGGGTLALSNNGANRIYSSSGTGDTLVNSAGNTIQGSGQIGVNNPSYAFTLTNNGTILANQSNTLQVASGGTMTNNGTFQANSGSLLNVIGNLTNYNPATSTLTGGTFNAYSGIIQLSQADATAITPAVITTNAATILLDGASANILDGSGNHILLGFFTTNAAAGNFTIQNGKNLTSSSSDFSNAGTLTVGANSTFTVGGSHNFNNSGLLEGIGTVQASLLSNSGTVHPGDGPGILTVTGSYAQTSTGALGIQIGGSSAGTGFSQLNISGSASLAGTLDLSLINGFIPSNGETFEILTSSGLSGTFSTVNGLQEGNVTFTVAYTSDDVVLDAHVSSSAVPEPASWLMLGLGLTAVGTCVVRKSRNQVRGK